MNAHGEPRSFSGRWAAFWHAPSDGVRAPLLTRAVLVLLGVDTLVELAAHGARYGQGRFNVAHFAWLDAVAPLPTPALYVGLTSFSALLALTLGVLGPPQEHSRAGTPQAHSRTGTPVVLWRAGMALVTAAYTYAWAMSLLDSYQHHYLLSIYLLLLTLLPEPFVLRLFAISTGLVYAFTGYAKTERDWRSGAALSRIAAEPMEPFLAFAQDLGVGAETFWPLVGMGVVVLQFVVAAGYVLAPYRDHLAVRRTLGAGLAAAGGRVLRLAVGVLPVLAWAAAIAFHVGAEILALRIGWFSYYMMLVPTVLLLPGRLLAFAARAMGALDARAAALAEGAARDEGRAWVLTFAAAAGIVVALGAQVDLPGATWGFGAAAGAVFVARLLTGGGAFADALWRMNASMLVAAALLLGAVSLASTRYDFYRFAGRDAEKRGTTTDALHFYEKAQRYAPEGVDRRAKIEALRAAVRAR